MPFPWMITKKMNKLWNSAKSADACLQEAETLFLFNDPSAFKSDIYLSVAKEISGEDNVSFSGKFVSKVFDGPYKDVPKFMKEMDGYLAQSGEKAKKYFIHYSYCPKCSKEYGHNYMTFFAEIA